MNHLVLFGLGNIGSFAISLLARLPGVSKLTLVDFDRYEAKNLSSQAINTADIGQPKAHVQARLARRINPKLTVVPIFDRLENVPLGRLRGNLCVAFLDSLAARRNANEITWRLGMPLVDAGVEPSLTLARVNVYQPGEQQPCLECAWSHRDYADLPIVHPCNGGAGPKNPSTNAPAFLGALCAALAAIECQKLISGRPVTALIGRQVIIEATTHRAMVTSFGRNPKCLFDHRIWKISRAHRNFLTRPIGSFLKRTTADNARTELAFGGHLIVKRLDCPSCGFARSAFRLQHRLRGPERSCDRCGAEMLAAGFYMKSRLSRADLGPGEAERPLASLGLIPGDIISLRDGENEKFLQLTGIP